MAEKSEVYKCEICGNEVVVLKGGMGELVCCGQPMTLMVPKTEDAGMEKHLPVVEVTDAGVKVKIGSIPHPMEGEHFIQWIAVVTNSRVHRKFLEPGAPAEAEFATTCKVREVRSYCNLHGLWSTKQ